MTPREKKLEEALEKIIKRCDGLDFVRSYKIVTLAQKALEEEKPEPVVYAFDVAYTGKQVEDLLSKMNVPPKPEVQYCECPEYQYRGNTQVSYTLMPNGDWRSQGLVGLLGSCVPVCWKCLKPRREP